MCYSWTRGKVVVMRDVVDVFPASQESCAFADLPLSLKLK